MSTLSSEGLARRLRQLYVPEGLEHTATTLSTEGLAHRLRHLYVPEGGPRAQCDNSEFRRPCPQTAATRCSEGGPRAQCDNSEFGRPCPQTAATLCSRRPRAHSDNSEFRRPESKKASSASCNNSGIQTALPAPCETSGSRRPYQQTEITLGPEGLAHRAPTLG